MLTFGEKLRDARKNKKLTQRQLASLIDAKHNSISNWENDQNRPDPDTITALCEVLEIEPSWLLKNESSPIKNETVQDYLKNGQFESLPEEAKKELEMFFEFLVSKYTKE